MYPEIEVARYLQRNGKPSLVRLLQDHGIRTVIAGPIDIEGQWRVKRYPADAFASRGVVSQPNSLLLGDVTDDFYTPPVTREWEEGLPDARLQVDVSSMHLFPGRSDVACFIGDYVAWDGSLVDLAPRTILRRVVEQLGIAGFEAQVAIELEFHVLKETPESLRERGFSNPTRAGWGRQPFALTHAVPLMDRWIEELREAGVPITAYNCEYGAGHFEINMQHTSPLRAADEAVLLKKLLRDIAHRDGHTVSFMARLATDSSASSGHIHTSLWRDDKNAFWDPDRRVTSRLLDNFVAGIVSSLHDMTAVGAPFVNSYKRLLEHSGSPTTATWGIENRSAALRVIAHEPNAVRVENRVPGADANPYLSLAATLGAGLNGIELELEPPAAASTTSGMPTTTRCCPSISGTRSRHWRRAISPKRFSGRHSCCHSRSPADASWPPRAPLSPIGRGPATSSAFKPCALIIRFVHARDGRQSPPDRGQSARAAEFPGLRGPRTLVR